MVNDVWKRIGIILSALWLIVAGCFECVVIYFVNWLYEDRPLSEYLWTLSLSMLAYIVFGLGPFLAFILLMKKRNETICYRGLTVLALSETTSSCPLSVARPRPVRASHSLTVLSELPEVSVLPSGEKATDKT